MSQILQMDQPNGGSVITARPLAAGYDSSHIGARLAKTVQPHFTRYTHPKLKNVKNGL